MKQYPSAGYLLLLVLSSCAVPSTKILPVYPLAPVPSITSGSFENALFVVFRAQPGNTIFYTVDGTSPTPDSFQYQGIPIHIEHSLDLKAIAIDSEGLVSTVSVTTYVINSFRFFVAGHVYGRHIDPSTQQGIHPELKVSPNGFSRIVNDSSIRFGFFVEDSVSIANEQECSELDADIGLLRIPVYLAPGNHDYSPSREFFTNRYGNAGMLYRTFIHGRVLFIVLDSQLSPWNIEGEQLLWLRKTLEENQDRVDRAMLFSGKILWASNGHYENMNVNWREWGSADINFWPDIVPLLQSFKKPVSIFGGDVCAFDGGQFMTDTYGNIQFFATGMGGGLNEDHYLMVTVNPDETMSYEIIPLYQNDIISNWKP